MSMFETNGKKIASVLTAVSAVGVGVSVYTALNSEKGQEMLEPVVRAAQPDSQVQLNADYYIDEASEQKTRELEAQAQEQQALARSRGNMGKQEAKEREAQAAQSIEEVQMEQVAMAQPDQSAFEEAPDPALAQDDFEEQPAEAVEAPQPEPAAYVEAPAPEPAQQAPSAPTAPEPAIPEPVPAPVETPSPEMPADPAVLEPAPELPAPVPAQPDPAPIDEPSPEMPADPALTDPNYVDPGYVEVPDPQPVPDPAAPADPQPVPEPAAPVEPAPVPEAPVAPEVPATPDYSQLNANIAQAAINLVGVTDGLQCTEVVQMALANAGVSDAMNLWPNEYAAQYGYYTTDPQAGNLVYYNQGGNGQDHIAIYIGNGQAVHGNYTIDGVAATRIESVVVPGCTDYAFIQVCR